MKSKSSKLTMISGITPEVLTPVCHDLFERVRAALPEGIAGRLKSNRTVHRHGSNTSVLQFNVWDRAQPSGVLHRNYFNYNLVHDPLHVYSGGSDWYFQFYANTWRIYQSNAVVREQLLSVLGNLKLEGFAFQAEQRMVTLIHRFNFRQPIGDLPDYLSPFYQRLVSALHPQLVTIIDSFQKVGGDQERLEFIRGRSRPASRLANSCSSASAREYSRSIPKAWKPVILKRSDHQCVLCGVDLHKEQVHIDHIIPVAKGGLRTLNNLQALCAPCNLKKGSRID